MKKIMFNDEYGLTQAVLEGRKTMTRRIIKSNDANSDYDVESEYNAYMDDLLNIGVGDIPCSYPSFEDFCISKYSRYYIGEVVAVAQRYKDVVDYLQDDPIALDTTQGFDDFTYNDYKKEAGWNNKMFVRGDLMPHQIRITDISVEKLQDISDEDCLREGIYGDMFEIDPGIVDHYTGCITKSPILSQGYIMAKDDGRLHNRSYYEIYNSPKEAFASLINKVSHRQIWKDNPYVFVYKFELL